MTLTMKLWRLLRQPPMRGHALYRRLVNVETPPFYFSIDRRIGWLLLLLLVLYVTLRFGVLSFLLMIFVVPTLGVVLFLILPLLLPPITALLGGLWAARISGRVVRERDAHTYDLLCIAPAGPLGANWAIASASLHQGDAFVALRFGMTVALALGGGFAGIMALVVLFMLTQAAPPETIIIALRTTIDLLAILLIFWIHYIQSLVLSTLVGMAVPTLFEHRVDASLLAFALYEALQLATYLLLWMMYVLLAPVLDSLVPADGLTYIALPLAYAGAFVLLRELVILRLWQFVISRLNAGDSERDVFIRASG